MASSSADGQIKLWNMHDLEFCQQFIVPKEECLYVAMHQFKPYMICAYSDGFIRFFDLSSSKLLGRCQIFAGNTNSAPKSKLDISKEQDAVVDQVVSIRVLPSGNHIFAATKNG